MTTVTRFAPSPTGLLHVGNAYSALYCQRWANAHQAQLLLRIEDIDHTRCRPEFTEAIIEDLNWLGIKWHGPVSHQSQQLQHYRQAISKLRDMGVIYPCFCTRKHIQQEIERISSAPHAEEITTEYPGICRNIPPAEQTRRMQQEAFAWRLDIQKAMSLTADKLSWREESGHRHAVNISHDIVIGRKDISFSYHLAVVVDDALQKVTHIIRGKDLEDSTGIHRLLQKLLNLPEPVYIHHPLLHDNHGERLAKRRQGTTLRSLRELDVKPQRLSSFLLDQGDPVWPFEAQQESLIRQQLSNG